MFSLLLFLSGCRSNYALLYDSFPSYEKKISQKKLALVSSGELPIHSFQLEVSQPSFENKIKALPKYFPPVKVEDSKLEVPKFEEVFSSPSVVLKQDPVQRAKEKKKRKRRRFWRQTGSNLFIGAFFLGIAIVLTLVHLQSLAALFGLASILFLFFGLKKFFKKRKRGIRNPFQKNK
ncbi:hypothetical protein [Arcticibacterium luteifluviistationis]|uniref:hypothetical protein n=1 Tax=Arcticibacterium luteifluviistationis TaxID=1784714 RepID=UPI0013A6FD77|nr:hypothetical protein [Arcticibacterium luteifluviistationis]